MPSTKKQREESVAALGERLADVQGLAVADFAGVKTPELNELRAKLKPVQSECRIVKNRLTKIALKNKGLDAFNEFFTGQSALIFHRGDALTATKILVEFAKAKNIKLKAGLMDGRVISSAEMKAIASLPSKEILVAMFAGTLQSPLQNFHSVLQAPVKYLLNALQRVAEKKPA